MKKKPSPAIPNDYLLIADGIALSLSRLKRLSRNRFVVAIDGAANILKKYKLVPNLIMGDFDGISPETKRFFQKKGVDFLHTPDQHSTDLEKAIHFCMVRNPQSIHIAAALGGRSDHSLANASFLKKFHQNGTELSIYSENERIFYVKDQALLLRTRKNSPFAILGFPKCVVSSAGLGFELKEQALELGVAESVSNHATKALVSCKIRGEALVILEDK